MNTVSIDHKSRVNKHKITWEANDATPWPLIAQDDGELFDDSTRDNIASYMIGGASVTLPYPINKGNGYAITPVKVNAFLSASITIKERRSIDKDFNTSVPVYTAYDGRYLYLLLSNNTIEKHDCALFSAGNYAGTGGWTTSPLVSTITLPTPPDGSSWGAICFVKNGGIPKIICIARINATTTTNCYACYLKLSDETVWDLSLTNQNGYTNITTFSAHTVIVNIIYDYASEHLYLIFNGSSRLQSRLDLNTNTLSSAYWMDLNTSYLYRQRNYYIPTSLNLSSPGVLSLPSGMSDAAILGYNYTQHSGWAYHRASDRIISGNAGAAYATAAYFKSGILSSGYTSPALSSLIGKQVQTRLVNNNNNICFSPAYNVNALSWYQLGTGKNNSHDIAGGDIATGQTGFYDSFFSNYNNLFFSVGNTSAGRKRLFVFDIDAPNQTMATRYLDRSFDINNIHTNQLL